MCNVLFCLASADEGEELRLLKAELTELKERRDVEIAETQRRSDSELSQLRERVTLVSDIILSQCFIPPLPNVSTHGYTLRSKYLHILDVKILILLGEGSSQFYIHFLANPFKHL